MDKFSAKLTVAYVLVLGASASLPVIAADEEWRPGHRQAQAQGQKRQNKQNNQNKQNRQTGQNHQNTAVEIPVSSFVAQPSVSAAQAAAQVRRAHGGRVLSVSPSRRGDSLGYRVRVLIDGGRVKTVYVASGQANSSAPSNPAVRTIGDR